MKVRQKYPVYVEKTSVSLVWVEGDNAQAAAQHVSDFPYDYASASAELVDGWVSGRPLVSPDDWARFYDRSGPAPDLDAHVVEHSRVLVARRRAACSSSGHPGMSAPLVDGRRWCQPCLRHVPVSELVVAVSA